MNMIPRNRIDAEGWLIVACMPSVLALGSQSASSIFTYLLTLLALFGVRSQVAQHRVPFWVLVVTLLYFVCSGFWSEPFFWRELGSTAVRALLIACFVLAFAEVYQRDGLRAWFGRSVVAVGLCATCAALAIFFWTQPADGRLNGLGQLDTHVVAALVYGCVAVFGLQAAIRDVGCWKLLGVLAVAAGLSTVFLSDSRNAWVSVAIGIAVLALAERLASRKYFLLTLICLGAVLSAVLVALLLDDFGRELVLPRGDSFRPQIWAAALNRLEEANLLVGLGVNASDDFVIDGVTFLHPHSMYLAALYQGGIVGLLLFLCLASVAMAALLRSYQLPEAKLGLALLAIAMPSFLLDGHELLDKISATWLLFWLPVAIAVSLSSVQRPREC